MVCKFQRGFWSWKNNESCRNLKNIFKFQQKKLCKYFWTSLINFLLKTQDLHRVYWRRGRRFRTSSGPSEAIKNFVRFVHSELWPKVSSSDAHCINHRQKHSITNTGWFEVSFNKFDWKFLKIKCFFSRKSYSYDEESIVRQGDREESIDIQPGVTRNSIAFFENLQKK